MTPVPAVRTVDGRLVTVVTEPAGPPRVEIACDGVRLVLDPQAAHGLCGLLLDAGDAVFTALVTAVAAARRTPGDR